MRNSLGCFVVVTTMTASCFAAAPIIYPSTPTVYVSSTMQFTSDQSVEWSVLSGSTGTIDASGIYTAPSSFLANNVWKGIALLPNDSAYNVRIDTCPILTSSNTYFHTQTTNDPIFIEVDMPDNIYTSQTNQVAMSFQYSPENDGNFPMNGISSMTVENGIFSDENQVDQHILGGNINTGQFSELYKYYKYNTDASYPNTNSRSGIKYGFDYASGHGVDAAGMKLLPFLNRYEELVLCRDYGRPIKHAGRFTLPNGYIFPGWKWPATYNAVEPSGSLPYGTWIRLKANVSVSTYSATAQCILNQWKQYGLILTDGGISMHVQFAADSIGDYSLFQTIGEINLNSDLTANDFEVVDQSTLQDTVSNSKTFHSDRVSTNTYTTPSQYAIVVASNTTTHNISYMPILLRPVTIGVTQPAGYSFMAGAPAYTLPVVISGAPNNSAYTCSMSPSLGTLTSGGVYTPPSAVTGRSSTTVTCASSQDPAVWTSFPLFVYTSTGARVSLANASNNDYGPDVNGNVWYKDVGSMWRLQGRANCDWTGDTGWGPVTDSGLYKNCEYVSNGNGDYMAKYTVANGTYTINLKFSVGQPDFSRGIWQTVIDSNQQIFSSTYTSVYVGTGPWQALGLTAHVADYYDIIGNGHSDTPGQVSMTRHVTDNSLYFAVRHLTPFGASQPNSALTAYEIALVALDPVSNSVNLGTRSSGRITAKGKVRFK